MILMSAVETSGSDKRFVVAEYVKQRPAWNYVVGTVDSSDRVQIRVADRFRSQCAAEYAARLLNSGLATINPHAVVGCRVEVRS